MAVGTFVQPAFGSQTGTAYKTNIDNSIAAMARIGAVFAPHEQGTPNMTVRIDAGALMVSGAPLEIAAQNSATIVAPTTNPRIDRVVVDEVTGVASVITGTQAASPAAPDIPAGKLPVCQVLLATTTTAIDNTMITDERLSAGGGSVLMASDAEAAARSVTDKAIAPSQLKYGGGLIQVDKRDVSAVTNAVFTVSPGVRYRVTYELNLSAAASLEMLYNNDTGGSSNYAGHYLRWDGVAGTVTSGLNWSNTLLGVVSASRPLIGWAEFCTKPGDNKTVKGGTEGQYDNGGLKTAINYVGAADLASIKVLVTAGNMTGTIRLWQYID